MISRVHSLDQPMEIEEGMVFALETYCAGERRRVGGPHRRRGRRHRDGCRVITKFPAEELLVCGKTYVRGADLLETAKRQPSEERRRARWAVCRTGS